MQELNLGIYLSRDHIISYNIAVWSVSSQSTLWVADPCNPVKMLWPISFNIITP